MIRRWQDLEDRLAVILKPDQISTEEVRGVELGTTEPLASGGARF
ncbi:MAG: hypothetical protein KatS3mg115_2204 [Candidatus Poribacteria bacterium]|nr:MAG: hypothetical protein KatS3mg115_2204 [Candidatus Poribacteria bacterium]